jgi:hypothetical protein
MPQWLKIMLLAAAVVIALVFLVELVLVAGRQHQLRLRASRFGTAGSCQEPAGGPLAANEARIVMADYDRVIVTCSKPDDTVLVLRPPGEDPKTVLRAARLVLAEGPYGELADQLGEPAGWPME